MKKAWMLRLITVGFTTLLLPQTGQTQELDKQKLRLFIEQKVSPWLKDPLVINAIEAQNEKHDALTKEDIKALDAKWKNEDQTLIQPILTNKASLYLKKIVEDSQGLISEVFVMDNKGLNVAQTEVTSDYWQGDEPKFQNTYEKGIDGLDIGDVDLDESTQTFQCQISFTLSDNGNPVGAITVGINADEFDNFQ